MSEEINEGRDMEPDPMFRIKCLQKQLQWMEGQRYDLETTVSSLRAILRLLINNLNEKDEVRNCYVQQAERMLKL